MQFEMSHHGQTRILANASPHASVSKPKAAASTSISAGGRTSSRLTAGGRSEGVSASAEGSSPEVALGASAAAAAAAAGAGIAVGAAGSKGDVDYRPPEVEGGTRIDVPVVQLDTPEGPSGAVPLADMESPGGGVGAQPTCAFAVCLVASCSKSRCLTAVGDRVGRV